MFVVHEATDPVTGEQTIGKYSAGKTALPFSLRIPPTPGQPGRPGIGKRFWAWDVVPDSFFVTGADFSEAPIVGTPAENIQRIAAITKTPEEVLIWNMPETAPE